jgi:hypothetical protein
MVQGAIRALSLFAKTTGLCVLVLRSVVESIVRLQIMPARTFLAINCKAVDRQDGESAL